MLSQPIAFWYNNTNEVKELDNVLKVSDFENKRRFLEIEKEIEERRNKISDGYKSDINQYKNYCVKTSQSENLSSFVNFLFYSVKEARVKKTTWEKRLTALRRYFTVVYKTNFKNEEAVMQDVSIIRSFYNDEENKNLKRIEGKRRVNKDGLLEIINKLPSREKAICLVNLVTTNRPSEMVRIKIGDFDLEDNSLGVYLKKQDVIHEKRLTQEVVKAVGEYIKEYDLKIDDYFVGRIYRGGRYESTQVSEEAYRKLLTRTTGLTGYNFRKTQVSFMHEQGADLSTIAKQTGHQSLQTISNHYLNVSDRTIDKYL